MNKGFTLVELLVSIAIFTAITTIAVYNHAGFNGSILLTNLSYEIALSIRQAQVYGVSVRQGASQGFNSGYGVHFDTSLPTQYVLFEDKNVNNVRDSGEDLQTFNITKGNRISKLCFNSATPCNAATADVTFIRPNPDAYIKSAGSAYSTIDICVSSPQNVVRRVTVESTGQISVSTDAAICN